MGATPRQKVVQRILEQGLTSLFLEALQSTSSCTLDPLP
jgi:hypothetical protein